MNNSTKRLSLSSTVTMIIALSVLLFTAVIVSADTPAETPAEKAQTDVMQFAQGAKTWANNCSRCHSMRDPKELRDDQWRAVVSHMRVRGNLTGAEARDVLVFLQGSN